MEAHGSESWWVAILDESFLIFDAELAVPILLLRFTKVWFGGLPVP